MTFGQDSLIYGQPYSNESTIYVEQYRQMANLNVKVKLSLFLPKCKTMKTYVVLNQAPRHEDVWGNGGIAPRILNLGTRRR
jgi:hypothetical protein